MAKGRVRNIISEDDIEQALLQRLQFEHGFDVLDCFSAKPDDVNDGSNRKDKRDVILADRLRAACVRLNPSIREDVIDEQVMSQVCDRRSAMSAINANIELDRFVRDGVPVEFEDADGVKQQELVKLIDFNQPDPKQGVNQYLAVSQLWIQSTAQAPYAGYRRPDVILYINGMPLVFIELKNSNQEVRLAFDDNLANYKHDIPQLFHCNTFCVLSNAIESRVGSFTAGWEHFFSWLRVDDEKEVVNREKLAEEGTSLERVISGLLAPRKLLDYTENFILYHNQTTKIIAQNHQFMGVNKAFDRFQRRHELDGKLGVFWHTQGSGKSFSMIFYARKIFRKVTGNFSFVVITDRKDLDGQIYNNFVNTQTVHKNDAAQPRDSNELRKFLGQNKKVVFTLIQKFGYDKGKQYPALFDPEKEQREVIVMVDEAHRTQYKTLAENMRKGLVGANFIAFSGTPLLGKKYKDKRTIGRTEEWFGDYVSEYNFQQAMDDGATVPLFYEKRVPEVLIQNDDLGDEFYELLEDEELSEAQQLKLEKTFSKEMQVIVRDDRLDTIAKDIVYHFPRRGYLGKGMIVTVDKFTAVKMYDKVQYYWKAEIKRLRGLSSKSSNDVEKQRYKKIIEYMKSVDMTVVISDPEADKKKFEKAGLDINPHIKRLAHLDDLQRDVESNFKDAEHSLQLVFVCAMWLTGFDAPTVSTLYLDKPMKNHTLMQTIARANRVAGHRIKGHSGKFVEKINGEIVDYYNVFRNMKIALKDYARGGDGEDSPVEEKTELFSLLEDAINQTVEFCADKGIDLNAVVDQDDTFKNISLFEEFADILFSRDEWRKSYNVYDNTVSSLYEACKPEIFNYSVNPLIAAIQYLRGVVDMLIGEVNIDEVSRQISELLDESVVVDGAENFVVREHKAEYEIVQKGKTWDLSKIDFDKLNDQFKEAQYKHIEIAEMRTFIQLKLRQMLEQNHTRTGFVEKLQEIIDRYNSGTSSVENVFEELTRFAQSIKEEDERHIKEGLTPEELELYDLLKKDSLTKAEEQAVKLAAKDLIVRLLQSHPKVLVQDWWKDTQTQFQVKSVIEKVLNDDLPDCYDRVVFKEKCENVYNLVVDFAANGKKWVA